MTQPRHRGSTGDPEADERVAELVAKLGTEENRELIEELVITALRIGRDDLGAGDLKLINRALREMRVSSRVFSPYSHERKVACYGSARTQPSEVEFQVAEAFARRMREHGFMVITGAGSGIMGASQRGAGRDKSFGLNIRLPFEQSANETIEGDHKLINFNYFFTRKLAFVKESDAAALFPGGFGTMDECFEVLTLIQTGKAAIFPVVMVDSPGGTYWRTFHRFIEEHLLRLGLISPEDFHLFKITDNVDEAVEEILGFYRVFHSYRFVRDLTVIRLTEKLEAQAVEALNDEFPDLLTKGRLELGEALPEEVEEETASHLPRLVGRLDRGSVGRFRQLINRINSFAKPVPDPVVKGHANRPDALS